MFSLGLSFFIVSFLILVHELGHFLAAKKAGLKVEEFGLGLPPRIFGKKIGETIYSVNLIPFGGFVRIFGDLDSEEDLEEDRSFVKQPPSIKLFVAVAGILMNFLLGFFIFWALFSFGNEVVLDSSNRTRAVEKVIGILQVAKNSPAEQAGLKPGDKISKIKVNDQLFTSLNEEDFLEITKQNAGQEITLILSSGREIKVIPRKNPPTGEGALGIMIAEVGKVSYPFFEAFFQALKYSFKVSLHLFSLIFQLFSGLLFRGELHNLSGPVGLISFTAEVVKTGLSQTLSFIGLISLNLAVFNLLPLPALDGGRILFLLWELLSRKPVPAKYEAWIHSAGMLLLLGLLILVTFNDLKRLL